MDTTDLIQRIERLETQNLRLRRGVGLAALATLALLAATACGKSTAAPVTTQQVNAPAKTSFDEIEVRSLVLKDAEGRVAATLGTDDYLGTVLKLYTEKGDEGIMLSSSQHTSRFQLNVDSKPRFQVEAFPESGNTAMRMFNGKEQVVLYGITEGDLTSLYLLGPPNDKGIKSLIGLSMPPDDFPPSVTLRTRDMKQRAWTINE